MTEIVSFVVAAPIDYFAAKAGIDHIDKSSYKFG